LAAVVVALAAAVTALHWLRRQPADGSQPVPGQTAVLRTRVQWEAGAVAAATVLAMLLSNLTPAKVAYRPVQIVRATIGPYSAEIRIYPARTGTELITVTLTPTGPHDIAAATLSGVLHPDTDGPTLAARPVSFPVRASFPAAPGETPALMFRSAAVSIPTPGEWSLDMTVTADRWHEYIARIACYVK
jgi:hypothetical protein